MQTMKLTNEERFPDVQTIKQLRRFLLKFLLIMGFAGCTPLPSSPIGGILKPYETDEFKSYWYAGKAEINSYKLNQSRYGENRDGKAILIFVTEDFSRKKQVKLDNPSDNGADKVGVLKLNFTKNFVTGIYPYSMMLSVFSPIDRSKQQQALKVTMSSQEWCGHVFSQMNLAGSRYSFVGHSYFEKEGEQKISLASAFLEDELWNTIRLDHESLPVGDVKLIPGLFFSRLNHTEFKSLNATLAKTEQGDVISYSVSFLDQERNLVIHYQKTFPYRILGWDETFTERGEKRETRAVLDKTLTVDYWKKNKNEFRYLRDSLGLSPNY